MGDPLGLILKLLRWKKSYELLGEGRVLLNYSKSQVQLKEEEKLKQKQKDSIKKGHLRWPFILNTLSPSYFIDIFNKSIYCFIVRKGLEIKYP